MRRMTRITLMLILGLGTSALVSWCIYQYAFRPAQAREDAFAAIEAGQIMPGPGGITPLPPQWAMASIDQKAYITRDPMGTIWALFLKERGEGASLRGYLFTSKLTSGVVAGVGKVELDYPIPAGANGRAPVKSQVTVRILRVAGPSSYEVVNDGR